MSGRVITTTYANNPNLPNSRFKLAVRRGALTARPAMTFGEVETKTGGQENIRER